MAEYIKKEDIEQKIQDGLNNLVLGHDAIEVLGMIYEMPSADVAPVRHGEWIVCGDGDNVPWMCSHCGKTTAHKYKVMYGKYCPNCGAKMDGADNG